MTSLPTRPTVVALACAAASLVLASGAQAHTLSVARAKEHAQFYGAAKVKRSDGEFYAAQAFGCKRLYPHIVLCKVGYDSRESIGTTKYECVDKVELLYRAHSIAGESRTVFAQLRNGKFGHGC